MFLIFSFLWRWYSLVLSGREQQQSSGMNNHNNKSRDRVGTASSCSLKTWAWPSCRQPPGSHNWCLSVKLSAQLQLLPTFYCRGHSRATVCTRSRKELCGTGPGTTLCCLIVDVKWGENTLYCRCHNIAPSGHFASTHYTLYTNHQYTYIFTFTYMIHTHTSSCSRSTY